MLPTNNHSPQIIGITGRAGAGKDTVATMLEALIYMTVGKSAESFSLANRLKFGVAGMFNIPFHNLVNRELKEQLAPGYFMSSRELMQRFGSAMRKEFGEEIFTYILEAELSKAVSFYVDTAIVTDIRYQNEAKWLLSRPNSILISIDRPGDVDRTKHHHESEDGIDFPDLLSSDRIYHICNDGTKDHLQELVKQLVTKLYL